MSEDFLQPTLLCELRDGFSANAVRIETFNPIPPDAIGPIMRIDHNGIVSFSDKLTPEEASATAWALLIQHANRHNDRIEALEAANRALADGSTDAAHDAAEKARAVFAGRIADLEAKLATAVEALEAFAQFEALPGAAKRSDLFEIKVRRPMLSALAQIKET